MSLTRFTGKTVLVTGAASGMGAAIARRFCDEGANVALVDWNAEGLKAMADSLPADRSLAITADISDWDAISAAVAQAVDRFGALHVVAANAGIAQQGTTPDTAPDEFRKVVDVDLVGTFLTIKAAYAALKQTKGCIVATSSVSGTGGDWGMVGYNAAKGGVTNLVRAIALDAAKDGIRINAVNPTLTRTGMTEEMLADPDTVPSFNERVPLGAPAEPEWIAGPVAFLASEDARYITGVNLPVDGGVSASNGQPG